MRIDFDLVTGAFVKRGMVGDVQEFRDLDNALQARIESECSIPQSGKWGDPARICAYARALRQVLLHRTIAVFEGTLRALSDENAYMMLLAIRAQFETTAAIGYLHNRLHSLGRGDLDAIKVDQDIMAQLLGTKDKCIPQAMPPKQILSMLEYADESVSKRILGGKSKEHTMLRESYDFLCEFAHPNFHSNKIAFNLDKLGKRVVLRHHEPMRDDEFGIVHYSLISTPIHIELHDAIEEVLPTGGL